MDGRGWAVQPGGFDPNTERTADAGHALDTGLRELSRRLDELMVSVEMLGAHGRWDRPAQPPQPPPPAQYEYQPPPPPAPVYGGWANPYEHAEPSWRTWEPEPGYLPTPIEPAAWEQPFEAPAPAWAPAVHVASPPPAPLIEVANLDAGPFADLVELRHFEDDLGQLARVRDVRVRRFGNHRASIEVAVSSAPLLEHELHLLGREMSIGATPEGEVVVELVPEVAAEDDEAAAVANAFPAEGDGE
jgi:hypothetical protein